MKIKLEPSQAEEKAKIIIENLLNGLSASVNSLEVLDEVLYIAQQQNLNITFTKKDKEISFETMYLMRNEYYIDPLP